MSSEHSITHWVNRLQAGDREGAQKLWEAYFRRLVGLARAKLEGTPRRVADEEDVALSAFHSFFKAAEAQRFPNINDRNDLWRLLVTITVRKAQHQVRDGLRQKRGGGAVVGESALRGADDELAGLEQFAGEEPTPAFAAEVAEECRRLLEQLGDVELQQIAQWKMEGDTNPEIAAKLGCAPPTVERRLALIRRIWQKV